VAGQLAVLVAVDGHGAVVVGRVVDRHDLAAVEHPHPHDRLGARLAA
jgi:hypothetical protein